MSAAPGLERNLTPEEALAYVEALAAEPQRWRHLVRHDPGRRVYEEVAREASLGVWVICWLNDHDTGFHDHDISSGAVHVVEGAIRHERLRVGAPPEVRIHGPGDSFSFDASEIHRMAHHGAEPAVTLHAYSPPLWRMGAYEVLPCGTLRRHALSYAEELRPIQPA